MYDIVFLGKIYTQIKKEIAELCNSTDVTKQEELRKNWIECIDHHDEEFIEGHIGLISGLLRAIDIVENEIDETLRNKEFEQQASLWLEVI